MLCRLLILMAGLVPFTFAQPELRRSSGMPHIQGRVVQVVRQEVPSEPSADRGYITVQAERESLLAISLVHVIITPETEIRKKQGQKGISTGLKSLKEGQLVLVWVRPWETLRHPVYPLRIDGWGIVIVRGSSQDVE